MEKIKKIFFYFSASYLFGLGVLLLASFAWSDGSLRPAVDHLFESPSWTFWLGSDSLGRDLLKRIILGGRVSLLVGVLGALLTTLIGLSLGVLAGWNGGWVDRLIMRLCDIFSAIPSFALLAVLNLFFQALMASMGFTERILGSLICTLVLTHWMSVLRVVRAQVIHIKGLDYLEAARALGGGSWHIVIWHVGPALTSSLLVLFALQIPSCLISESFMSFVGLGVQSPMTSWGVLVSEGWRSLSTYPHLILAPSAVIFLTVFSFQTLIEKFPVEPNHRKWTP